MQARNTDNARQRRFGEQGLALREAMLLLAQQREGRVASQGEARTTQLGDDDAAAMALVRSQGNSWTPEQWANISGAMDTLRKGGMTEEKSYAPALRAAGLMTGAGMPSKPRESTKAPPRLRPQPRRCAAA